MANDKSHKRSGRISILFSVLAILAMVLVACGGQPTQAPPTAPPATEPAAVPTEPAEEPAAGDLLGAVTEAGVLLVSSDPNYAPQSFLNDAGDLDGFDIDVSKEVASRLGVDVEFVTPDWDMVVGGNWSARWDISIGSMTPTEPRSEVLWFTDPYYYTPASFAVHQDNTDINSVADLAGKTLGLGTATTYEDYLNDALAIMGGETMYDPPPGLELKPYPTDAEAIQDLALGDGVRLDAVMSAQPTIQTAIDSGVDLKYVGTPAFYEPLVFALDKSRGPSDAMVAKLNEILAEMRADGTLTELSLEWYGIDLTTLVAPEEAGAPAGEDLLDAVQEAGVLLVSSDPNYAPQSFLNDAGELDGFDIDVSKEVAERLGVDAEFVTPDWDMVVGGNWSSRWDISIGSMTPTEPRSEVLWFTDPYYYTPASFAVHQENTDITSVADLAGKTLGLGTATTYEDYLNDALAIMGGETMYDPPAGLDLKPYPTDAEAIQDLALGDGVRLDAVMSAQPTIQTAIDSGVDLKYVGTPAFYEPLVFALDKSRGPSDAMVAKLNEILAEMRADGTLTELSLEWYGIDLTTLVGPEEAAAPAGEDLLDEVQEAGVLLVSSDPNYAPQSFLNDAGELDGFDIDVSKEVADRLGVDAEFVTPDWDMVVGGNWSARWDISIGSMTPTEPRSEVLWFTDPYYYTPASFAVHQENTDITSVADLSGKTVGLGTATTYEDYLNDTLAIMGGETMYDPPAGLDLKPYPTDAEAIQDLALGDGVRLDAVMSAQPTIQTAIDSGVDLKYVGTPAFYEPLVFALDKSRGPSDAMVAELNDILAEMRADGTLTELSLEWYGIDLTTLVAPE